MKKNLLVILVVAAVALAGCKKDSSTKPSGPTSDSYWPPAAGNSWTYKDATSEGVSNFTIEMTGGTHSINNKTYYVSASEKNGVNTMSYIYEADNIYTLRDTLDYLGTSLELPLCDDAHPAGYTWTIQPTDNGTIEGVPTQAINQIISADDSMTVNGKNYTHVIHTEVLLQYDMGAGFETVAVYDFYLAKGIGMIEADTWSGRTIIESETLTGYSVK
ncbi:MAG TPA: hypothetical protein VHS53_12860 [Mucilaginibacter sp.]|jgi:hypothetical protein|nr:hypothetical protein [Mucilaginibacter sp.]